MIIINNLKSCWYKKTIDMDHTDIQLIVLCLGAKISAQKGWKDAFYTNIWGEDINSLIKTINIALLD